MASSPRTGILLVAAALLLAGCVNHVGDTSTSPTSDTLPTANGNGAFSPPLPALPVSVKMDGPNWVEPGTQVPVSASAAGVTSFIWATGALPGTVAPVGPPLNTSLIEPGGSKTRVFSQSGLYNMHCHPHPFMRSNVTVIEGYAGPDEVDVQIQDGATTGEYRFVPENIVVGEGTKVTYHAVGALPHTSTELQRSPPLKQAKLASATGLLDLPTSVPMPGMDMQMAPEWTNIIVVAKDAEGRVGIANASVYINAFPAPLNVTMTGNFPAPGLPDSAVAPASKTIALGDQGTIYANFTAVDGASKANPTVPNSAAIDLHVKGNGETQDVVTSTGKSAGSLSGRIARGSYTITVSPNAGANVDYQVFVTVQYDHVPPAPLRSSGGAEHQH